MNGNGDNEASDAMQNDDVTDDITTDDVIQHGAVIDVDDDVGGNVNEKVEDIVDDMEMNDINDDDEDGINPDDNSILSFEVHQGSVFIITTHDDLAVSGGEDDTAFVWNYITGEVSFQCTGHKDSVTCCNFNHDGTLLSTGDMSGVIKVWNVEKQEQICDFETGDLEWLQWHSAANILLAGTSDGEVWMWKIPKGESKIFPSPGCTCTNGKILPGGKTAAFTYSDGSLRIFDLKTTQVIHAVSKDKESHRDAISDVDFDSDGKILATASLDGTCKIININTGKVTATYRPPRIPDSDNGLESVGFSSKNYNLLAAASLDGTVSVWDVNNARLRHQLKHPDGVTKLAWLGPYIVTSCVDGICRLWNGRNSQLVETYNGSEQPIFDINVSKNGKYFLAASSDGWVRVYSITDTT